MGHARLLTSLGGLCVTAFILGSLDNCACFVYKYYALLKNLS